MTPEPTNGPADRPARPDWVAPTLWGAALVGALLIALIVEVWATAPVRGAVRAYTQLLNAANEGDLDRVRRLCTASYLRKHPPRLAPEGGVEGLPRNIHKNFQTWREGRAVLLCPTNRVGPVLQFLPSPDGWKFDGIVGLLRPGNHFIRTPAGGLDDLGAGDPGQPARVEEGATGEDDRAGPGRGTPPRSRSSKEGVDPRPPSARDPEPNSPGRRVGGPA